MFGTSITKINSNMKYLKKSHIIFLLMLLAVVIGSWTIAPVLSDWNLFDQAQEKDLAEGKKEENTLLGTVDELGIQSSKSDLTSTIKVAPEKNSMLFQSTDGGQTWMEIGKDLPELDEFVGFFAGESEVYLSSNGVTYRSKSELKTPSWEQVSVPNPKNVSIAFNPSGVLAYSYDGYIYQQKPSSDTWLPIFSNLKNHQVQSIFETSDGTIFLSSGKGLYKSSDKGQSWKRIQEVWVGNMVESDGVLLATGQKGIMRSTDNGENWDWVISEGGVGIAVEKIAGGFAAISYNTKTKSRRIRVSLDKGKTWEAIDYGLKPSMNISSVKQLGNELFVGHPDGIFSSSNMGKSWNLVHQGVDSKIEMVPAVALDFVPANDVRRVFDLFVSDEVLYAVARMPGC